MQLYTVQKLGNWNQHLVMIHGNSSSSLTFKRILQSDLPLNMTAIDLPGHGKSPRSIHPELDYSLESNLNSIQNVISKLNGKIILYGNSLGGHYAMELLKRIPEQIESIIISGAPPVDKPPVLEKAFNVSDEMLTFLNEDLSIEKAQWALNYYVHNKACLQQVIDAALATDPKTRLILSQNLNEGLWSDQKAIVENSLKPVFHIHGEYEPGVKLEYIKSIKNISKIYQIRGAAHFPQLENAGEVISVLNEILTKLK